ncbi:MAG TPA: hypothetical protein VGK73_38555 [Polyangiaceae bacterium]
MTPKITQLVGASPDVSELVSTKIAAILEAESERQQELAAAAGKKPYDWILRVRREPADPIADFPKDGFDEKHPEYFTPVVTVSFDAWTSDERGSNLEQTKCIALYRIDCYGYAVTRAGVETQQVLGDYAASVEALRAARVVRNILMHAAYTYLDMRGVVGRRDTKSLTQFEPESENQTAANVVGARLVLEVQFVESNPQVEGELLEEISVTVTEQGSDPEQTLAEVHVTVPPAEE